MYKDIYMILHRTYIYQEKRCNIVRGIYFIYNLCIFYKYIYLYISYVIDNTYEIQAVSLMSGKYRGGSR